MLADLVCFFPKTIKCASCFAKYFKKPAPGHTTTPGYCTKKWCTAPKKFPVHHTKIFAPHHHFCTAPPTTRCGKACTGLLSSVHRPRRLSRKIENTCAAKLSDLGKPRGAPSSAIPRKKSGSQKKITLERERANWKLQDLGCS